MTSNTDTKRELDELERDWADAELRGDSDILDRTLADDFVAVGPRGFTLTKEEWLQRHASGDLKYETFTWEDAQARLYGDTAVAIGRQTATGSYQGQPLQGQFRVTQVLVKQHEIWLLAGIQLSPIAGPP